jgi:hypothetical protein
MRNLSALDEDSRGVAPADIVVEPLEGLGDRPVLSAEHVVAPDALELSAALQHLLSVPQALQARPPSWRRGRLVGEQITPPRPRS